MTDDRAHQVSSRQDAGRPAKEGEVYSDGDRRVRSGMLLLFPEEQSGPLEWLVLDTPAETAGPWRVIPADTRVDVGRHDITLSESREGGPLTIRGAYAVERAHLDDATISGEIRPEELAWIRAKLASPKEEPVAGRAREDEQSLDYQEWMETVAEGARRLRSAHTGKSAFEEPAPRASNRRPSKPRPDVKRAFRWRTGVGVLLAASITAIWVGSISSPGDSGDLRGRPGGLRDRPGALRGKGTFSVVLDTGSPGCVSTMDQPGAVCVVSPRGRVEARYRLGSDILYNHVSVVARQSNGSFWVWVSQQRLPPTNDERCPKGCLIPELTSIPPDADRVWIVFSQERPPPDVLRRAAFEDALDELSDFMTYQFVLKRDPPPTD